MEVSNEYHPYIFLCSACLGRTLDTVVCNPYKAQGCRRVGPDTINGASACGMVRDRWSDSVFYILTMRPKQVIKDTVNGSVWRKLRHYFAAKSGDLHCDRCMGHSRKSAWGIKCRSWKEYRNRQYKRGNE